MQDRQLDVIGSGGAVFVPVSGSGRRIDAGTPAAALGQQQRAGQACPSALTSLKPPHPA